MKQLAQSVIVTAPRGVDLLAYVRRTYLEATDQVVTVQEHTKPKGVAVGIFVEDIRDIQAAVRTKRAGQPTVVTLYDAASMTRQAQAALLKLLEEPRDQLYLVLLTHTVTGLSDTILSRCQLVQAHNVTTRARDTQIQFMSHGVSDEVNKLTTDRSYRQQQQARYEQAKRFIGADAYTRLAMIVNLQRQSRQEVIAFIDAMIHISDTLLRSRPSASLTRRTQTLLEVSDALHANGNIRTQLLRTML